MFAIEFELFYDGQPQQDIKDMKGEIAENMKKIFEEVIGLIPEMNLQYLERCEHGICTKDLKKQLRPDVIDFRLSQYEELKTFVLNQDQGEEYFSLHELIKIARVMKNVLRNRITLYDFYYRIILREHNFDSIL